MQENKPHILYLSYDGMTDPLGQSQVLAYLEGLSGKGFRFTLISFEKTERYEKSKAKIEERCSACNIKWLPLRYTKKPPVLSTLYDVWRLKKKVAEIYHEDKFQIIHCRSYITALVGLSFKRKYGVKFVFDMRGFYADERVDGKIWNLDNPVYNAVYRFFKKKEIHFLSEADYVISLTEAGKKIIHSWKQISNQPIPIQVIPCCADLDVFNSEKVDAKDKARLRNELSLSENDFVLSYLGSISTWYMLDEMLDCFKVLLEKKPDAKFLFITNESPDFILSKAKQRRIGEEAIRIVASPHNLVPAYLSLSDAGIFFIKPVFSKQASSPTKQGELMGMGLLHICNKGVGDVDEIVRETNCGVVVNNFTVNDYHIAAHELLRKVNLSNRHIREASFQFYSLEKGVKLYAQVYQSVAI